PESQKKYYRNRARVVRRRQSLQKSPRHDCSFQSSSFTKRSVSSKLEIGQRINLNDEPPHDSAIHVCQSLQKSPRHDCSFQSSSFTKRSVSSKLEIGQRD